MTRAAVFLPALAVGLAMVGQQRLAIAAALIAIAVLVILFTSSIRSRRR